MQCNCMMGVFPEISRAWLTIDSDIFMWNYEDGGDLAYFDGLSETILAVGLVKPKAGIFQPHVRHLLVLATPVDIVILGLHCSNIQAGTGSLNDSMSGGMQLLPDPLYSLPTDNTYILAITSSDNGRIFLAGKDGCLYEVVYQAEAGWFSQRCRKINHSKSVLSFLIPSLLQFTFSEDDPVVQIAIDNSRNILYTRSEKGVLQVYDLGQDGQGMTRVTSLSQNAIVSAAGSIARTIDRSVFKPIIQIAVIENSESIDCQLLAITHAGVRLYFSTSQFKHPTARPSMLTLVHVRLPPGFSASSNVEKPSKVHRALYSKGVLLMAASENEDNDILWCVNHDSFPFQKPMMETQMTTRVDGHSWALSAIDDFKVQKIVTPLNKDIIPITDSPVVVQQHMLPPKKFVLLSAQGSFMFHKLRPVDQLRHLLVSNIGGDGEEIERFFKLHQEDQACATCLILACSTAAYDREVSAWATRAFFRYGGEAQMRFPSALPPPSNVGPILGSPVPSASPLTVDSPYPTSGFLTSGQGFQPPAMSTPIFPAGNSMSHPGTSVSGMMGPEIVFSGRHNGICIYFARIIGFSTPANLQQRLLGFMRPDGGSSQQVQQELQRKYHAEAQLTEKTSLQGIQQLVRKTCQALALWKLLCEHQFSVAVGELQKELQEQLKITAFKDLVIRDRELTGALIASLINCYIRDNAAVDGIIAHLQDICPLLYSTDDAVCSKANELLQRSRQAQSKMEKEKMLRESLKEYQKISNQVDLANVCAQYRQVRFYEGVVELCLTAAEKKDPQGLGLHFYKNGEPEEDVVGLQAFQERQVLKMIYYHNMGLNSYKCITDTLQELVNQSKAAPQSPSVPKKPGPPVLSSDPNMLSNEEAGHHFEQMLKLAQRSTDELFSIALYNWLIQADLADKLLQVTAPFLEPYLVRMTKIDQNKVRYMDLLWRYFEKNRNFSSAARVLAKLADLHSTEISLQQRLEYIARAILSAKSSTAISSIAADGEFLHELEEKMELYGEFADPFKLSECKLAIIHCAGHSDPILVQTLWQEIIEKDFLVQFLEQQVCSLNWDVGFVTYTMQEIGVSLPRLLEVYDQLFKARDPYWNRMKKPLHLLECIHVLLSGYVQDPSRVALSSLPYQIQWVQQTCSLVNLVPHCVSVKSRGALLCAFARDGLLLAVAVNQADPKATQVLFLNTLNFVTVSGSLKGCSSKSNTVPSKLIRQQHSFCQDSGQSPASSDSERDLMRQRFSVASHSRLPYLIVSDGYMITVLRFPNNFSPSGFIRSLLLDSTQQLENIRRNLLNFKDYEEESDDEKQFYSSSSTFHNQRILSIVGKADQGHLEFASMFDTMHADDIEEKDKSSLKLNSIQKNLLTAWQIGISKAMEEKDTLLNYTVNCIIHFFSIVQFVKCSLLNQDASLNKSVKNTQWMHCVLKYFQQCLTVLYWHSRARVTAHVAKLTLETLKLLLIQQQDQLFSKNLLACFCLLKMVSHTLSSVCVLQYGNSFACPDGNVLVELDSLTVPVFLVLDDNTAQQFSSLKSLLKEPPRVNRDAKPERRLIVLWRLLYKKVIWYQVQLKRKVNKNVEEASLVSLLISHIQAILQSSGVTLEQHLKINSVSGEKQFLLGSYRESVDTWKRSLCDTKTKDTKYFQHELWMITSIHTDTAMAVIRSMARFMAAYFTNQLLYIFPPHNVDILHPLHIKQDLSPRVIPLQHSLVTRAVREQNLSSVWTAEYALDLFFIGGLIPEAVWLAKTLGDWKLSVSIGLAYQLYCQNSEGFSRLKNIEHHLPLDLSPMQTFQEKLQSFLGQPVTSETSGHIKYKKFTGGEEKMYQYVEEIQQKRSFIFVLTDKGVVLVIINSVPSLCLLDPIEEEDADVLYSSIQELLKAAVMADADILSETFQLLMDSTKDLSRKLYGLVPVGLYLPAPPLYCPQPASLSEEDGEDMLLKMEREIRQKVSGVLQRIILLFRAARCSCPSAQWYITQLKWARKVMQKIRIKGSLPLLSPFPETLLRYCDFCTVLYGTASSEPHQFDDISCKVLGWFRELCALCWMLHVREKLSDNCRQYQAARENINTMQDLKKNEHDASTVEHCLNAVGWACRMLPFCRFMNAEELVQDVILSLLGELPPMKKVAETFVKAFPNPEDIRVPLRDKYNALQQRLRQSVVKVGPENEESMSVVIQASEEARKKALRRVIRNIGPIEIHIWEPAEEEAADDKGHCYDRFSIGTSLSTSTLTDLGNPQVYSDADTADTLSDALCTEEVRAQTPSFQRNNEHRRQGEIGSKNTTCKIKAVNWKTIHKDKVYRRDMHNQCNLPLVGAWEFERDDDEYVRFLELFLSYVLERDLIKYSDIGIPFLTSFSGLLQEHELNSLFFDVHTTLKRRQGKSRSQSVFRAGSCYTVTLSSCNSEITPVYNKTQNILEKPTIVQSLVQTKEPFVHNLMKGLNEGLFGLKHKSIYRGQTHNQGVTVALASQTLPNHTSSTLQTHSASKYIYKPVDVVDPVPGEELAIELMDKLSNIAKLLEWMIRWSDKRLICGSNKQDSLEEILPMIHMKTSSAAVLTSLWLLEQLYRERSQTTSIKYKHSDNQDVKEFASLSEAESRTEKESSVDESFSIAANPLANVQNVPAYNDFCETNFRISTKSKYFDKKEIIHGNYSEPCTTEDPNEVGPFVRQELNVTSERQGSFEEPYETPKSSNSSAKIKPVEHPREKASYHGIIIES
ncbi:hypothetical protein BTVI_114420 [Pitangus sulphuratus]|nr:hypothetical protein BTVI_114420 [Pitangus sulphuratus]